MNKLRLISCLVARGVEQNARQSKNTCHFWHGGGNGRIGVGTGICLVAWLLLGRPAGAAGPSLTDDSGAQKLLLPLHVAQLQPVSQPTTVTKPMITVRANHQVKARRSSRSEASGPGYRLTVTVRNPRCPACLKTLKAYLLALNGVREVSINYLSKKREMVDIIVGMAGSAQRPRVIERIKAHDLEILRLANSPRRSVNILSNVKQGR